jgi:hypothetical protein
LGEFATSIRKTTHFIADNTILFIFYVIKKLVYCKRYVQPPHAKKTPKMNKMVSNKYNIEIQPHQSVITFLAVCTYFDIPQQHHPSILMCSDP